ncbi:hypothetical protein [Xanthomonas campestris]|uniref:hypothetical protein n=1 Tax=Xanthomonas campestris TaxID=339 RepID=UPI002368A591|nr:hypothetical protein [Xanthomonas campestris]WDK83019.1 hypothetical protein JH311_20660 [Xanthomonas campestris pv. campestris]WDK87431.1 hypothetical protein JH305_01030 [Xanthomonas campestris pv. campestris]WDK91569.1 hypothetical protein JH289_01080 [Xanthomonas campestris pv. campestris]WDL38492.1 hypothetical protein JH288_01080 [Xanthomonas campestris pv. campestris]
MSDLVPKSPMELVDPQAQIIVDFLKGIGLPHDNIIATQDQRAIISQNLPAYIQSLPAEVKHGARYLSKFVVGAGIGLFDYSLNAIWNEVVLDLHKKAISYGLDIFYDAAIGGKAREFYQSEEDLRSVKDAVLLDTCRKLELISDTTHKKLKHILDMRNDIGISHPTNYTINAFELLGWLQNCIQDVLNDRPTEAALKVQAFIQNLKSHTQPLDQANIASITSKIGALASHHCGNVLRTMFGIYVSSDTDPQVRKNISLLAVSVWNASSDETKYRLGLTLEGYNTNLYREKYQLGEQFLQSVGGNAFRSNSERAIIVDGLLDQLLEKHQGWDNFHHEAPVADSLSSYISGQQDILPNFASKFVKTILMCRIGRGINYCRGVSPRGLPYYDRMIALLGDQFTPHALAALTHYDLQSKLDSSIAREQACLALAVLKAGVVNQRLVECIDFLITNLPNSGKTVFDSRFKTLSSGYITW